MSKKQLSLKENIETSIETGMFASRWLMAPIYIILCLSLAVITFKVIQHFFISIPFMMDMKLKEVLLFVLKIVDMALIGNLVLMIIFAGYENFVSRIDVARGSPDKPSWMGQVDFSGLKLKLVASIVAISGINLLEAFMSIGYVDELGVSIVSDREIRWMIIVHVVFIISGVLLALMDYIASITNNKA
tara:strand:- start:48 stop:611 length:564 start_codon:yes stop_codon:yes gene_type:complete